MNQNLITLMPLIIILGITIFVIIVIKSNARNSQNINIYQTNRGYKLLCKSQSNRVIAGVCGGISEHFGWNATIVRLFFLFSGIGLFTYIVLAIVIPDSDSPLLWLRNVYAFFDLFKTRRCARLMFIFDILRLCYNVIILTYFKSGDIEGW